MASEEKKESKAINPYSNLEAVFGPYVKFIEQTLTKETPTIEKPIYEKQFNVRSLQEWDEKKSAEYEYGNRIIAPESTFKSLLSKGAEPPIILQIFDPKTFKILTHCSVIEWTAPNDTIYIPMWMIKDFKLKTASSLRLKNSLERPTTTSSLRLRYYAKPYLKGSFI